MSLFICDSRLKRNLKYFKNDVILEIITFEILKI